VSLPGDDQEERKNDTIKDYTDVAGDDRWRNRKKFSLSLSHSSIEVECMLYMMWN
jgi:hypothetical protein